MQIRIAMIRSGMTQYDVDNKLTGVEDIPLCKKGITLLEKKADGLVYPKADRIYTGSLLRCMETAWIAYKGMPAVVMNGMKNIDYGILAGKSLSEAAMDQRFRDWASAGSMTAFGAGEPPYVTIAENARDFKKMINEMEENNIASASLITHRFVILMLLRKFCLPLSRYYGPEILCGGGCSVVYDTEKSEMSIAGYF